MGLNNYPKKGEIYLVSLDPTMGAEINKTRPALIISNNTNNKYSSTVTIIPITSAIKKIYPFEVLLSRKPDGLNKKSKAKCNQIRTIDKIRLVKFLDKLDNIEILEIDKALLIHLDIT